MVDALFSATPRLAVVIPIFRHSVLLVEAIESVLAQTAGFAIRIVLVNDGCPFPETEEVCRDYAFVHPGRIVYLRKPNGGLSDARNHGIRYTLDALPSVEAIYMMDADNALRPDAMMRAMAELDAYPEIDWIYPNIDMFGLTWRSDYGGDYSLLIHTAMNICEAGSLIRRRVFEASVLFDTSFKLGWEDWDFFLSAAERGFRGRNLEDFGFLYRKRPESMLADSERDQAAIGGAMSLKHKALLKPQSLLALEQIEAPRYAIYLSDRNQVLYCVDPLAQGTRTVDPLVFETDYWRARTLPGRYTVPPFTFVMSREIMDVLRQAGLLHWVLWKLENMTTHTEYIAILSIKEIAEDRIWISETITPANGSAHKGAMILAINPKLMEAILQDNNTAWIDSLAQPHCAPAIASVTLALPAEWGLSVSQVPPVAVHGFLLLVHRLHSSTLRSAAFESWDFREIGISLRNKEYELVRKPFNGSVAFPRLKDGRRHIGFLLPLVEFGGVEKVALNIAKALKSRGWVPHAIILSKCDVAFTAEWRETFESTSFLTDTQFSAWGSGHQQYLGTTIPHWAAEGRHGMALGMLHWLDTAANFHGGAFAGIMGQLKRLGVKTIDSLHLNDLSSFARPEGNTQLGLAYEHAFDLFLPCSYQLGDWLHSMGVPREKIVVVQNAPGFEAPTEIVQRGQEARLARGTSEPLRVLYLGRLDRQKGLDRLTTVLHASHARRLNFKWRIIGKSLMANDAAQLAPEMEALLEPPTNDPVALAELYAWADIVLLLSSFEGLSLTVLEAMRSGAVMIATDVGATGEVLKNGENGILLPLDQAVEGCINALENLAKDRSHLHTLSARAYADRAGYDWTEATKDLASRLAPKPAELATQAGQRNYVLRI